MTGLWRLTSFAVATALVLAGFVGALAYLSPEIAVRIQVLAPSLASILPSHPESAPGGPALLPAVPDTDAADLPSGDGSGDQARPTAGRGASAHPLGRPPVIVAPSGSYHLLLDGTAYDPCRPVHYVTRPDNMPAGGQELIREAVESISLATGLVFVDDGVTDEPSTTSRKAFQPERYGDRWAPVLFTWKTAAEQPAFNGNPDGRTTVGIGGSTAYTFTGRPSVYVSGEVQLNAGELSSTLHEHDGSARVRSVIEHELAHVVGLGHVDDPSQLMAETTSHSVTGFGAGDLTGLALLGAGQCVPEL